MALASVSVLNPRAAAHVAPCPLRVTNGEPDARIEDMHRRRDVLEIFVEAAALGRVGSPSRKTRLDAEDHEHERARVGPDISRRVHDDHDLGIAGVVVRVKTSQGREKRNKERSQ